MNELDIYSILSEDGEGESEGGEAAILEEMPVEEIVAHEPDASDNSQIVEWDNMSAGLEALEDALTAAVNSNSMNPEAAKFAGLAITIASRNMHNRGIGFRESCLAAAVDGGKYGTESFNDKSSATAYAGYALLGVSDQLRDIWKKIVAFLTEWFDKSATWFNKMVSGAAFAKRKAQAVIKKADKMEGSTKKDDIELNEVESLNLTVNGSFNPKLAIEDTVKLIKTIDVDKATNITKTAMAKLSHLKVDDLAAVKAELETLTSSVAASKASMLGGGKSFTDKRYTDSSTAFHFKVDGFAGNKMIIIKVGGYEASGVAYYTNTAVSFVPIDVKAKGTKKVKGLVKGEIIALADVCEVAADALIKAKNDYREGSRIIKELDSDVKNIIKDITDNKYAKDNNSLVRVVKARVSGLATTASSVYSITKALQSQSVTTINAALNYCIKSMSNHKKD